MNDINESSPNEAPRETSTEKTSEPAPAEQKKLKLSKPVVVLAGSVMVMPAMIPLWFAIQADSPQMMMVFAAMSFVLVVVNMLLLYVIYRWLLLF